MKGHLLSDITFDYNFDNNLEIMPIVKNLEHFNKWIRAYPFYNNIKKKEYNYMHPNLDDVGYNGPMI